MVKISSIKSELPRKKDKKDNKLEFCPYTLLNEYRSARGPYKSINEPFFVLADGSPVTDGMMRTCLHKMLTLGGFDASLYSTHSLRIGRSMDLRKLGLSVETIKKIGRWRSNAVFKYLR